MSAGSLPLRALVAFEASARLGSFQRAADELGLTPSAISHQIRLLEARIGLELFLRAGRGVVLTHEGKRFQGEIGEGFELLRRAMSRVAKKGPRGQRNQVVTIHTPPSFAARWLLPRLPSFLTSHPSIDVRVIAETGRAGVDLEAVDFAVSYGRATTKNATETLLLRETVQPLCHPSFVEKMAGDAVGVLLSNPIIVTSANHISWDRWAAAYGIAIETDLVREIHLDPSDVAIEAAAAGLGIVLESDVLAEAEMTKGLLVPCVPGSGVIWDSYWLLQGRSPQRAGLAAFQEWLVDCARLSMSENRTSTGKAA